MDPSQQKILCHLFFCFFFSILEPEYLYVSDEEELQLYILATS